MSAKLSEQEVDDAVEGLKIWGVQFGKLATRVEFENYDDAVMFANTVFSIGENESHRPEVKVTEDAVEVDVWTPDIGITEGDVELARQIEEKLRSMDLE